MKCVVLAAGRGTRMMPLTAHRPKPMVLVKGKPLLYHILKVFEPHVDEFVIVIGYHSSLIQDYFGYSFRGKKIHYVYQEEPRGTFQALLLAKKFLEPNEKFFVVGADDIHGAEGVSLCVQHELALLVSQVSDPRPYGVVTTDDGGAVVALEEKPENPKSTLVSTGVLLLNTNIFDYTVEPHKNGEYYLTKAIEQMIATERIQAVNASFWFPISTPQDVAAFEKLSVEN